MGTNYLTDLITQNNLQTIHPTQIHDWPKPIMYLLITHTLCQSKYIIQLLIHSVNLNK